MMEKKKKPKDTNSDWGIGNSLKSIIVKRYRLKKEWAQDKSGYCWRRNIYNPLFKNLHIIIDADIISVWCEDQEDGNANVISQKKFSGSNLSRLIEYFTKHSF